MRKPANRRVREEVRRHKAAARTATYDPEAPPEYSNLGTRLKLLLAVVVLVPVGLVTTQTFFELFTIETVGRGFWQTEEFWFFGLGFVAWLICFWGLPRPLYLYVLGHELTHYAFVKLCGGKVEAWDAKSHGGYVYTDKSNTLISLSPYFVPFYTVLVGIFFALLSLFVDLDFKYTDLPLGLSFKWHWLFLGLVGLTWGFHLTFTVWMMTKDQPDLQSNGNYFSVLLISLVNLVIICTLLVVASQNVTFAAFIGTWWENMGIVVDAVEAICNAVAHLYSYLFGRNAG